MADDRVRLENLFSELRRQQREEQLILDSVPAMIWFKDCDNRILKCNRAAAESATRRRRQLARRWLTRSMAGCR